MYSSPVRRSLQVAPPSARLACVRHAASVQSEPGSNSSVQKLHSNPRRRHYSSSYKHVLATFYSVALPCDYHKVFAERPHKTLLQIVKYLRYLQPQATNAALNPTPASLTASTFRRAFRQRRGRIIAPRQTASRREVDSGTGCSGNARRSCLE